MLDDEPGRADAVVALSELYEKTKRDEDLAELLSAQIERRAASAATSQAELRFQVRLGEVYDSRLGDRERAIETYRARARARRDAPGRARVPWRGCSRPRSKLARGRRRSWTSCSRSSSGRGRSRARARARRRAAEARLDGRARPLALERGLGRTTSEARSFARRLAHALRVDEGVGEAGRARSRATRSFASSAGREVKLCCARPPRSSASKRSDHGGAAELLDRASALQPGRSRALARAVRRVQRLGPRQGRGRECCEKIVDSYGGKRAEGARRDPPPPGQGLPGRRRDQRAIEELDKAFRIEPGNVERADAARRGRAGRRRLQEGAANVPRALAAEARRRGPAQEVRGLLAPRRGPRQAGRGARKPSRCTSERSRPMACKLPRIGWRRSRARSRDPDPGRSAGPKKQELTPSSLAKRFEFELLFEGESAPPCGRVGDRIPSGVATRGSPLCARVRPPEFNRRVAEIAETEREGDWVRAARRSSSYLRRERSHRANPKKLCSLSAISAALR